MIPDPHLTLRERVLETVLRGPGVSSPEDRAAVFAGRDVPSDLATLVAKVHQHAYKVTDTDVAVPTAARGDDAMFELIVSAAVGAANARLAAGQRALEQA